MTPPDARGVDQKGEVAPAGGLRRIGHGARRQQRHLLSLHEAIDREGEHRRDEKDHPDDRAHREVLLADDLLVGVGREHVELAADHLRDAEIGDDEGEDHEAGADDAVARARQGDGPEDAGRRRAERRRRLVEAPVGERQRGHEDQERVREAVQHLGDDDADRAVDRGAHQNLAQEALVTEDVEQRQRRQQRRREDRQERRGVEQALRRHAASGQAVGIDEGERHDDRGRQRRDGDAVEERGEQRRGREVDGEVAQADEAAIGVLEALREQRPQRQRDDDDEDEGEERDQERRRLPLVEKAPQANPDLRRRRADRDLGHRRVSPAPPWRRRAAPRAAARSAAAGPRRR